MALVRGLVALPAAGRFGFAPVRSPPREVVPVAGDAADPGIRVNRLRILDVFRDILMTTDATPIRRAEGR
jgi:hypothetical protein